MKPGPIILAAASLGVAAIGTALFIEGSQPRKGDLLPDLSKREQVMGGGMIGVGAVGLVGAWAWGSK